MNKKFFLILLICSSIISLITSSELKKEFAYYTILNDVINPVTVNYLINLIEKSENDGAQFLIIQLDTPGGLVDSTRILIKKMLSTKIPIIIYVAPSGAHAASAGTFILQAADIAAMAPNTQLGAAHPVVPNQKIDEITMEKITNDLITYIKNLAQKNNRNDSWVIEAVKESKTITEKEALELNVINLIAVDINDLIKQLNNREIKNKNIILKTDNIEVKEIKMNLKDAFLSLLANPNVAYILLTIGIYGIIYEFATPGFGFAGITGIICLLLAFAALQFFPLNLIGLLFIILGAILFLLEIKFSSSGLFIIGAIISIILGSLMLINVNREIAPYMVPSYSVIFGTVAALSFIAIILIFLVSKSLKLKPQIGDNFLIGKIGRTTTDLNPEGFVIIFGERWRAKANEFIPKDAQVKIIEIKDNLMFVEKI
ncbi:MAG TPA: nodulation protein NfeD [bacterium]|nr:nodulation protein NfeD [bacterium]HOL48609.1 nodulation protein NfeD [bacterium]HPQ19043.1 nodulation protein NfeD [bacterium]